MEHSRSPPGIGPKSRFTRDRIRSFFHSLAATINSATEKTKHHPTTKTELSFFVCLYTSLTRYSANEKHVGRPKRLPFDDRAPKKPLKDSHTRFDLRHESAACRHTTLARRLFEELGGAENVCYLFHDSYYKDISHKTFEERAQTNFDHPDSLETDLLLRHLQDLKAGQGCQVPTYDFATHSRTGICVDMQPKSIIIVEGILLFTHADLISEMDVKVFVDAESDIRLMRRIVRDTQERGRTVEEVLEQYHATVRPMHDEWVVGTTFGGNEMQNKQRP
eukprot:scaffold34915_cov180-Amphora_coffeaeformis.AAC.10